jgi:hypothetical protein
MQAMKTLLAALAVSAALSGCVVAPVEPGPVVYAAPAPVVVAARPYYAYPRYGYAHPRYGYWHRGYWR